MSNLTPSEIDTLRVIVEHGPISIAEINKLLNVVSQTSTRHVRSLALRGLVKVVNGARVADRRATATPEGEALVPSLRKVRSNFVAVPNAATPPLKLMRRLTPEQFDTIDWIGAQIDRGKTPSQADVAAHFGLSANAVGMRVRGLVRLKCLDSGRRGQYPTSRLTPLGEVVRAMGKAEATRRRAVLPPPAENLPSTVAMVSKTRATMMLIYSKALEGEALTYDELVQLTDAPRGAVAARVLRLRKLGILTPAVTKDKTGAGGCLALTGLGVAVAQGLVLVVKPLPKGAAVPGAPRKPPKPKVRPVIPSPPKVPVIEVAAAAPPSTRLPMSDLQPETTFGTFRGVRHPQPPAAAEPPQGLRAMSWTERTTIKSMQTVRWAA